MKITSLYNGYSGVISHQKGITSVADNLANVSTYGFKSTRANFKDVLASKIVTADGNNPPYISQIGNGSFVSLQNMMMQGSMEETGNALDLAIEGNGFFSLLNPDNGLNYFSRAGAFMVDDEGYVVNPDGLRLQGYVATADGTVAPGSPLDILLPLTDSHLMVTSEMEMGVNLDAGDTLVNLDATAIDPSDTATYNYSVSTKLYDSSGVSHPMVTYFQQLDEYRRVWKAATYESDGGAIIPNPAVGNEFYLHFDTDGKMTGTSTALPTTDSWLYTPQFSASTEAVSERLGGTLSYTSNAVDQTYISTAEVDIAATYGEDEVITIAGDAYDLAAIVTPGDTNLVAAQKLAQSINAQATNYWATVNGSAVTLHSNGTSAVAVSAADTDITITHNTMDDVIAAVNSGVAAGSALYLDLATFADGDTVDVGANGPWTYNSGGLGDFQNLSELGALITAAGYTVTTIDPDGNDTDGALNIEAAAVGAAGNGDNIAVVSAGGTYNIPQATLTGGMDDSATTNVVASAVTVSSGGNVSLNLARNDAGVVTVSGFSNTLGSGLGYDFDDAYRDSSPASTDLSVDLTHTFNYLDEDGNPVTTTQNVNWDYGVNYVAGTTTGPYTGSTQSAGVSELFHLGNDGSVEGWLSSVEVDDQGVIWGSYTSGYVEALYGLSLGIFKAPGELQRAGDTLWLPTTDSGAATFGVAGEDGIGEIEAQALEASNVDLAGEFVNMINYQRAFQANGKSITTADEMLKTAINLKG